MAAPQQHQQRKLAMLDFGEIWPGWKREVQDAVLDHGKRIVRRAPGPGSTDASGLDYRVLTTRGVQEYLPKLEFWYAGPGYEAARAFDPRVQLAPRPSWTPATINVNLVAGQGGSYEWHTDDQSHTMVLFASTFAPIDGGELQVEGIGDFIPIENRAVIFDSSRLRHCVAPLARDVLRVTVVAQYLVPDGRARSENLNDYLYGDGNG